MSLALASLCALSACSGGDDGGSKDPGPKAEAGQIEVTARGARACEALVAAEGGEIVGVEFASGAAGKHVLEGDRAGISFVSSNTAALPAQAGTVLYTGTLKVLASTCYAETGDVIDGDGIRL